jgi:hypothetical protein
MLSVAYSSFPFTFDREMYKIFPIYFSFAAKFLYFFVRSWMRSMPIIPGVISWSGHLFFHLHILSSQVVIFFFRSHMVILRLCLCLWAMRFTLLALHLYARCFKNVLVRLLGTRFTNAISSFECGPQEPYRDIFKKMHCPEWKISTVYTKIFTNKNCSEIRELGGYRDCEWINPYSAEPVLEIMLFFTCSIMGALLCNYLLDKVSREHDFLTLNQQDGHLQFEPKWNKLRSYAHGQLRLEQAKVAIASGV